MKIYGSMYNNIHEPAKLAKIIRQVCTKIKEMRSEGIEFDTIAFRGFSGAGVAYAVSARMKINVLNVRKKEKSGSVMSHGQMLECKHGHDMEKYIILDDFISTGTTVKAILKEIDLAGSCCLVLPRCTGILLYGAAKYKRDQLRNSNKGKFESIQVYFSNEMERQ